MIQFDFIFVYIYIYTHMNTKMFQIGWFNHQLENPSTLVTLVIMISQGCACRFDLQARRQPIRDVDKTDISTRVETRDLLDIHRFDEVQWKDFFKWNFSGEWYIWTAYLADVFGTVCIEHVFFCMSPVSGNPVYL